MADNHTPLQRHINMSHIRSSDTKPEEHVRKYLFSKGLRYRKNSSALPGRPDLVLRKYKTVVFVNGCFWHHHDCPKFRWPKSNVSYWENKIQRNEARDKKNQALLEEMGWKVIVVWECQLSKDADMTLERLYTEIVKNEPEKS